MFGWIDLAGLSHPMAAASSEQVLYLVVSRLNDKVEDRREEREEKRAVTLEYYGRLKAG